MDGSRPCRACMGKGMSRGGCPCSSSSARIKKAKSQGLCQPLGQCPMDMISLAAKVATSVIKEQNHLPSIAKTIFWLHCQRMAPMVLDELNAPQPPGPFPSGFHLSWPWRTGPVLAPRRPPSLEANCRDPAPSPGVGWLALAPKCFPSLRRTLMDRN